MSAPKYASAMVVFVNSTDISRLMILLINPFICFLDNTYKKRVDVMSANINECVIPLCAKIKSWGDNNPIHVIKIVSKSSEIPPKAPASLFLLPIAVKMM